MTIGECTIEGCKGRSGVPGSARGWCRAHYKRWQKYGTVNEPSRRKLSWNGVKCLVGDCEDRAYGHGYCQPHWAKWKRTGNPLGGPDKQPSKCCEDGCMRAVKSRMMCGMHYDQWRRSDARAATAESRAAREEGRQKTCAKCGTKFRSHRTTSPGVYCSRDCKNSAMERTVEIPCAYCQVPMTRKPSEVGRSKSGLNFCSTSCGARWRGLNRTATRFGSAISEHTRDVYGRSCVICGESRQVHYAHKKSAASGGTIHPTNIYVLCPTHHAILDNAPHLLTASERERLRTSAESGPTSHPSRGTSS